jgi:hypothetical protein
MVEREDTEPWYRQFWPWFIIAMLSSSVIAGLTTVWIALQTSDSLVVKSDSGMQIVAERRINAEQLAAELKLAALIDIDPRSGAVSATIPAGLLQSEPTELQLELTHPAFAQQDQLLRLYRAQPDANGNSLWSGHFIEKPGSGRWYMALRSGDDWRLAAEWRGEPQVLLRATTANDDGGH